jgi:hypothetical protein
MGRFVLLVPADICLTILKAIQIDGSRHIGLAGQPVMQMYCIVYRELYAKDSQASRSFYLLFIIAFSHYITVAAHEVIVLDLENIQVHVRRHLHSRSHVGDIVMLDDIQVSLRQLSRAVNSDSRGYP